MLWVRCGECGSGCGGCARARPAGIPPLLCRLWGPAVALGASPGRGERGSVRAAGVTGVRARGCWRCERGRWNEGGAGAGGCRSGLSRCASRWLQAGRAPAPAGSSPGDPAVTGSGELRLELPGCSQLPAGPLGCCPGLEEQQRSVGLCGVSSAGFSAW